MFVKRSPNGKNIIPGGGIWFLLVLCLCGYSTLNKGFAYIGSYPIFIGEFTLFFYLIIVRHTLHLPRFLNETAGKIWLIFFFYNFLVFLYSANHDLNESIRNSIFWVYSIFFYIGYSYCSCLIQKQDIKKFQNFLLFCGKTAIVYCAIYPLKEGLCNETMFLHGGAIAFIGNYSTFHALSISFSIFFIYYRRSILNFLWSAVGILSIVFISQSRASFLVVGAVLMYSSYFGGKKIFRSIKTLLALVLLLVSLYALSDIAIEGEKGVISLDLFKKTASSIVFDVDDGALQGSRDDRLLWWEDVTTRTLSKVGSTVFGMGFDTVLVHRATGRDTIIRYPHNSFISVFGFSGIIGLTLYVFLLSVIFFKIFKSVRFGNSIELLNWYPVFAIGYFISAFFSTVFEAPFHSFVFWVITGIAYRLTEFQGKPYYQLGLVLVQKLKNA